MKASGQSLVTVMLVTKGLETLGAIKRLQVKGNQYIGLFEGHDYIL